MKELTDSEVVVKTKYLGIEITAKNLDVLAGLAETYLFFGRIAIMQTKETAKATGKS